MCRLLLISMIQIALSMTVAQAGTAPRDDSAVTLFESPTWEEFESRRADRQQRFEDARIDRKGELGVGVGLAASGAIQEDLNVGTWVRPRLGVGVHLFNTQMSDRHGRRDQAQGGYAVVAFRSLTKLHLYGSVGAGAAVRVHSEEGCYPNCAGVESDGWKPSLISTIAVRAQLSERWLASVHTRTMTGGGWSTTTYGAGLTARFGR